MAIQNYTASFFTSSTGEVALTNVVSININVGRQRQLNQYSASTAEIVIRYPTGFVSPIAALVPGTAVRVRNSFTNLVNFIGKISNVQVQFAVPFSGGVGNSDYLTITCEASFAQFGRKSGNNYPMTAGVLTNQLSQLATQSGYSANLNSGVGDFLLSAITVSGNWADWLNSALLTLNARLNDIGGVINIPVTDIKSPFLIDTSTVNFSDTTNNATNQIYEGINFASYADNFYTQVTVDPDAFAPVTVTSGAGPYRSYQVATVNGTTGQATDYANYLLNNYKTPKVAVTSVTCLANAQNTMALDDLGMGPLSSGNQIGKRVTVTFRGTAFACVIEGYSFSAVPGQARYTYYVSAADLNAYLILNSATFGKLDENKLGY